MHSNKERNERLIECCNQSLADYAEGRKKEVERGRETPEFAALLVQKYAYGMARVLSILSGVEDSPPLRGFRINEPVASIDPDWDENANRRWSAKKVGLTFTK
ncbi:MAG: hypothetical protein PHG20_09475 [Geobacteraceae bacterium]|nr:hypothetical protein [Geobacteraceae bacterium]